MHMQLRLYLASLGCYFAETKKKEFYRAILFSLSLLRLKPKPPAKQAHSHTLIFTLLLLHIRHLLQEG